MLFLPWLRSEPNRAQVLVPLLPAQGFQLMAGSHPVTLEHREQAVLPPWGQEYICSSGQGAEDRQQLTSVQHKNAKQLGLALSCRFDCKSSALTFSVLLLPSLLPLNKNTVGVYRIPVYFISLS